MLEGCPVSLGPEPVEEEHVREMQDSGFDRRFLADGSNGRQSSRRRGDGGLLNVLSWDPGPALCPLNGSPLCRGNSLLG